MLHWDTSSSLWGSERERESEGQVIQQEKSEARIVHTCYIMNSVLGSLLLRYSWQLLINVERNSFSLSPRQMQEMDATRISKCSPYVLFGVAIDQIVKKVLEWLSSYLDSSFKVKDIVRRWVQWVQDNESSVFIVEIRFCNRGKKDWQRRQIISQTWLIQLGSHQCICNPFLWYGKTALADFPRIPKPSGNCWELRNGGRGWGARVSLRGIVVSTIGPMVSNQIRE